MRAQISDAIYGEDGVGMWSYDLIPNDEPPVWNTYHKRAHFAETLASGLLTSAPLTPHTAVTGDHA